MIKCNVINVVEVRDSWCIVMCVDDVIRVRELKLSQFREIFSSAAMGTLKQFAYVHTVPQCEFVVCATWASEKDDLHVERRAHSGLCDESGADESNRGPHRVPCHPEFIVGV